MNVIARLEYKLAYYDSAVHRFNHYTTRTPPNIVSFNFRTLSIINSLPKLTAYTVNLNTDIICIQEHRYYQSKLELKYNNTGNGWTFVSASEWKTSVNVTIGGVGILLSPCALKLLKSSERFWKRVSWDWTIEEEGWILTVERCSWVFRISTDRDLKHHKMRRMLGWGQYSVVSIVWLAKTFKNCVSLLMSPWTEVRS